MPLVIPGGSHERFRRQQCRSDGVAPSLELVRNWADETATVSDEGVSDEAQLLGASFFDIHGSDKGTSFRCQNRLGFLSVFKLSSAVRIASSFEDVPLRIGRIEAMLRVCGEGAVKSLQFADELLACLVRLVLEDGAFSVSVQSI